MKLMMNISPEEAVYLLAALTWMDQAQVRRSIGQRENPLALTQGVLSGRVVYRLADPDEHWQTRREILEHGFGDCEDLASGVAAELNETVYAGGLRSARQIFGRYPVPPLPPPPGPVRSPMVASMGCSFGSVPIRATPVAYRAAPGLYHVVVFAPGWGYLDPSVAGGMGRDYGAQALRR